MPMAAGSRRNSGERKGGYTYQPRSEKQNKARAEQTGQRFDSIFKQGFDTYRPKAGDNAIRILPPTWDGFEHYGFDVWVHGYVGVDKGSYLCLKKMTGKPCPICDAAEEAKEAGETEDAQKMGATRRVAIWLIDRNDDSLTPQLYAMPWGTDKEIMNQASDPRSGKTLMIDHPDDGYDILFKKTGEGIKTRYGAFKIDRDPTPIADKQKDQDEVMDFIQENPIPDVLNYFPPAYLAKIMEGTAEEKDELDEEVDKETGEVTTARERRARTGRTDDEGEVEDKPRRGTHDSRETGDEEEETTTRVSRGRGSRDTAGDEVEDGEEADRPRTRRPGRDPETEEEQEEMEARQQSRRRPRDEEDDQPEEKQPARRGRVAARDEDEEVDERPARRASRRSEPGAEEADDKPARGRRPDPEDDEPAERQPTRRARR
jgi:gp32 DNA binding protein like